MPEEAREVYNIAAREGTLRVAQKSHLYEEYMWPYTLPEYSNAQAVNAPAPIIPSGKYAMVPHGTPFLTPLLQLGPGRENTIEYVVLAYQTGALQRKATREPA